MQDKRKLQRYVLTLGGFGRVGRVGRDCVPEIKAVFKHVDEENCQDSNEYCHS